jgi:hypothetical protein
MRKLFFTVCILILGLRCLAQESQYHHNIIAILPFNTALSMASWDEKQNQGIYLQHFLYKAMMEDKNLLVDIQPVERTDSILLAAKIDLAQLHGLDMHKICELLHVDALLDCSFTKVTRRDKGSSSVPTSSGQLGAPVYLFAVDVDDLSYNFDFIDGPTGTVIWSMNRIPNSKESFRTKDGIEKKVLKSFLRNFPYTGK